MIIVIYYKYKYIYCSNRVQFCHKSIKTVHELHTNQNPLKIKRVGRKKAMFKIANAITNFSAGLSPAHIGATAAEDGLPAIQNGSFWSLLGGNFWSGLWLTLCTGISTFFYGIIRWVLNIVDFLQFFVKHLIGLDYWESGEVSVETLGESDIIFKFLYDDTVQRVFKYMLGIFVVLLILFSIIAIIKNEYAVATEAKDSATTMTIIKRACKAIFLVVLVPVLLVMGLLASNAVLAGVANAFKVNDNLTLGGQVFTSSAYNANRYRNYAENDTRYAVSNEVWVTYPEGSDKSLKIQTTVTPVVPKDFDGDDPFIGFMFTIGGEDYLYYVENGKNMSDDDYAIYVHYFKDILGAELKTVNDVDAVYVNTNKPYLIKAALSEKESKSALNKAAYNSWNFNSMYYNHSATFDETVVGEPQEFEADSGHKYSDARKYSNNTVWGAMHDGGANGLVALKDEYLVMADLIEFAVSNVTSIAFVNVKSSAIDWTYMGKDGQGYLSSRYINSNKSEGKITSLNSFVVNYKDSGYVIYDKIPDDKTAETDGAIYIAAYYSSSKGKYIPIVNNQYYVDDFGDSFRFVSEYLDSNYQGLVVVRGVLDPEFNNQYGYPTEIDVDWGSSASGVSEGAISLSTPKYYTTSAEKVNSLAVQSSTTNKSISFNTDNVVAINGNYYPVAKITDYSSLSTDVVKELAQSALPSTMGYKYGSGNAVTMASISWEYVGEDGSQKYQIFSASKKLERSVSGSGTEEYLLYAYACPNSSSNISIGFAIANSTEAGKNYFNDKDFEANSTKLGTSQKEDGYWLTSIGETIRNKSVSVGGETYFASTTQSSEKFNLTAKQLVKSFSEGSELLKYTNKTTLEPRYTSYLGSSVLYNFSDGETIYRITHDTENYNLKLHVYNQTYKLKIGENYIKVGGTEVTRRIYDMNLSSIDGSYHIYQTEIDNINYYFKFEYNCIDGIENYTPQASNYYEVTINKYNIFTYYKNSEIKQLNPITQTVEGGSKLETKVAYIDEEAISKKYIAEDDKKYIYSLTLRLQDEDKTPFATVYFKSETKYENISDLNIKNAIEKSYMATVDTISMSKIPDYSGKTDEEIQKMGLSTTATVIFKRQKVKANQFKSDIQLALFTKNTFRFKIAFFSTYSASQDVKSSFKIIGAKLSLDYNFTSTFASGLTVSTFYVPMKLNFVILIFAACLILSILGKAVWGVIQRIFDITVYFVILPGVASVMPFDNGTRFNTWTSNVVKKVFGAYGVIIGLNLFFVLIPPIKNISHLFTAEDLATLSEGNFLHNVTPGFINSVSELLFTLVALTMIQTLPQLVMSMLGKDYEKSDVVSTGASTLGKVRDMSKQVGNTISGKNAIEAVKNAPQQLRNFIPGSAVYDDIKNRFKKKSDVDPVSDSDRVAQEAAEARRRADANNAMAQADAIVQGAETSEGQTETPQTTTSQTTEAIQGVQQEIGQSAQNIVENIQNDTQSENTQNLEVSDEQTNSMAETLGGEVAEQLGDKLEELNNKDQNADPNAEASNGDQTKNEGDQGKKGEEGEDGKDFERAKYAEVAGALENPQDVSVSFAGAGDADSTTEATATGEDKKPDESPETTEKAKELTPEQKEIQELEKEAQKAQEESDFWENELQEKRANLSSKYEFNEETGDFIKRNYREELKGITDEKTKAKIAEEITKYNEDMKKDTAEYHAIKEEQQKLNLYKKECEEVAESLRNEVSQKQAEQNEEQIEEQVQESVQDKVDETVEEQVEEKAEEKVEETEKAEQAETSTTAQTSGDAEKAKLYTEAARLYADAAKGYADIATGKVDKTYGVDTRTNDQKKLDELKEKRAQRLKDQESGNADTGLSVLKRKKAYEQFNKDKELKDTIFSENEKAVKEAAIDAWNEKHEDAKLDIKTSAKKDIDEAVQKWKDERAVELYNKKHDSKVTEESLTDKQRKEARQLLDSDQYIKKATARSEFKDEKLDNAIAKQQEKIDLKAQGLYESGFKKIALALPRVLSRKTTEKDEEKLQEKLDKWEAVGREKKEQLEALENKERLENEIKQIDNEEFKKNNITSREQGFVLKLQEQERRKELKKELEAVNSALTDKDGNALNLDRATLEKDIAKAQRRFDAYSAQMQNGRSGLGVAFAREAANGARVVKSKLQSVLADELKGQEDKLNKKIRTVTLGENFDAKKYLTDSSYTGKEKFTEEQKEQLDARISAVDNAITEKQIRQKALKRRGLVLNTDGSINYEKSKAKMGDKFSKETVDGYYKDYNDAEERVKASKKNLTEMFNNFNKEDENSYVKLKTRLDKKTLARVKAEKAKVVEEFNNASRSGRLEEAQEKAMLDKIQGYDQTIEHFQSKTARYKSTKLTAVKTKVGNIVSSFTQKVQGAVATIQTKVASQTQKVQKPQKLSNEELAKQALANADVVAGRKAQISERDKAGMERTAEKIGKEEARKTMLNETAQRDYINKIRKTLVQSGFAGNIKEITTAQSAKAVRDRLEKDLMGKLKTENNEVNKKLIEQKLKKLRKVDLDISALGNSVNIRNEIKSATDKTKFRSEYIKGWNEYVKTHAKDPRLNARSGSVAYERSQKLTTHLKKEVDELSKQIEALKKENKTDSNAYKDLEKKFNEQRTKYDALKNFNEAMNSKLKELDSKTNKTKKSTMTMERIFKDMRRESKYKIKGVTNTSDKKD